MEEYTTKPQDKTPNTQTNTKPQDKKINTLIFTTIMFLLLVCYSATIIYYPLCSIGAYGRITKIEKKSDNLVNIEVTVGTSKITSKLTIPEVEEIRGKFGEDTRIAFIIYEKQYPSLKKEYSKKVLGFIDIDNNPKFIYNKKTKDMSTEELYLLDDLLEKYNNNLINGTNYKGDKFEVDTGIVASATEKDLVPHLGVQF